MTTCWWLLLYIVLLSRARRVLCDEVDCPSECQCVGTSVQCSHRDLDAIPALLPNTTTHLYVSGNNISFVRDELSSLPQLEVIDLSCNSIDDISDSAFAYNAHLSSISLQFNRLLRLPTLNQSLDLTTLDLSSNQLEEVPPANWLVSLDSLRLDNNSLCSDLSLDAPWLTALNASDNRLTSLSITTLPVLQHLDISQNDFREIPALGSSLLTLTLDRNPVAWLPNYAFANCSSLLQLDLSHIRATFIPEAAFVGLRSLQELRLRWSPNLHYIHRESFEGLDVLQVLDLRDNGLRSLHPDVLIPLSQSVIFKLNSNPWRCNCQMSALSAWMTTRGLHNVTCAWPAELKGLDVVVSSELDCDTIFIGNYTTEHVVGIGESLVLDCPVDGTPPLRITWSTNVGMELHYDPSAINFTQLGPDHIHFHEDHDWHEISGYNHRSVGYTERIHVLNNGSLYIDYAMRMDAGLYSCQSSNTHGNASAELRVLLNYTILTKTKEWSMLVGFACAVIFFTLTVLTSAIKFAAFFFSDKERKKRKGIKELLEILNSYKSSKVEQISAFKSAKLDQLSAFKAAKLDQLSAYKDLKVHKLTKFKSRRISKIRTYKQATVTNIVHQMQCMREYYAHQIDKVKDNCTMQAEKLKENTSSQMNRFKDYGSLHMDKIRDNYQVQAVRIRDYGASQMSRLREQYRMQQMHVLKLLELLDVGNCMTVIEAECLRTESMIFDPNLDLDFGGQAIKMDSGDSSDYMTPVGPSAAASVLSLPCPNEEGVNAPTTQPTEVHVTIQTTNEQDSDADNECSDNENDVMVLPATATQKSCETTIW